MTIRLLLADASALIRNALRRLLELHRDMDIVGEAGDCATAVALAYALRPDVVLLDLRLPGSDGILTVSSLRARAPKTRVILLTTFECVDIEADIAATGAVSYLDKFGPVPDIAGIIRRSAHLPPGGQRSRSINENNRRDGRTHSGVTLVWARWRGWL